MMNWVGFKPALTASMSPTKGVEQSRNKKIKGSVPAKIFDHAYNFYSNGTLMPPPPPPPKALLKTNFQSCQKAVYARGAPPPLPLRPGAADCVFFLEHGRCDYGPLCKFNHPKGKVCVQKADSYNSLGLPRRFNQEPCSHFMRTGECKYGSTCRFDHPETVPEPAVDVVLEKSKAKCPSPQLPSVIVDIQKGLPQRADRRNCLYFLRTGRCKFGNQCQFHHNYISLKSKC